MRLRCRVDKQRRMDKIGESPKFKELADKYEHSLMRSAAEVCSPPAHSTCHITLPVETWKKLDFSKQGVRLSEAYGFAQVLFGGGSDFGAERM